MTNKNKLLLVTGCSVIAIVVRLLQVTLALQKPMPIAPPHQQGRKIQFAMVTALYDLHRADRSFDASYMPWFEATMKTIAPSSSYTVVFCKERRVADAARRSLSKTITVLEENYPLANMAEMARPIIARSSAQLDPSGREAVEWTNKDYILLQFSKFRWLKKAMELVPSEECNYFFWVDAGISRFRWRQWWWSGSVQKYINFPLLVKNESISVQTIFQGLMEIPKNLSTLGECMGCRRNIFKGGLFGGSREGVAWLADKMLDDVLEKDFLGNGVIDNEQAAFALLYSRYPDRFNILFPSDFLGDNSEVSCNFICL
jgi:hypothetical protein